MNHQVSPDAVNFEWNIAGTIAAAEPDDYACVCFLFELIGDLLCFWFEAVR